MSAMLSFDFEMTSFVGIEAPEGTDPETLRDKALAEFRKRCDEGEAEVKHFQTYNPETGENLWEEHQENR